VVATWRRKRWFFRFRENKSNALLGGVRLSMVMKDIVENICDEMLKARAGLHPENLNEGIRSRGFLWVNMADLY
jgi:hypothetical protein